jgi:UvrD/REP helicase N-terminal domain
VVAIHRARRLASESPNTRVLLTTFSDPLAFSLERKLEILAGGRSEIIPRIVVASFLGIATELFQLSHAQKPAIASDELVRVLLLKAAEAQGMKGFTERFLISEWTHCVDALQIKSAEAYAELPRLGRKSRAGAKQRECLWPIFASVIAELEKRGFMTEAGVFNSLAEYYNGRIDKPFSHVIVDEAQDLGVPQLRFMQSIAPDGPDALFFAGDLGQRIFQQPFSWAGLGVDVRGRSITLKVNYRTSHQIREKADRLLPGVQADLD